MSVSSVLRRLLVPLLRDVKAGKPMKFRHRSAASQALYLVGKPSPSRKAPARARKEAKQATHREETGAIREVVQLRAGGRCENCLHGFFDVVLEGHLDHWLGGSGRRRQAQTVATTWLLCVVCDHARTHNMPNAAFWNERFAIHCRAHGYPFEGHIEHAPLPEAK